MTLSRRLSSAAVLVVVAQALPASTEECLPRSGSYEIVARLELPHLERWAVDKTAIICVAGTLTGGELPIPIVSANNPFAKCSTANLRMDASKLEYDIVCPERGAAKGHATYIMSAETFFGRVAMVLGGKNMTMTEVQQAHRIGECSAMVPGSTGQF